VEFKETFMTPGEIATFIVALTALGGLFLSMRSTSYNELKNILDTLREDFKKYKVDAQLEIDRYKTHIAMLQESNAIKDKQIDALEDMNRALMNQNDNFKRYITRVIRQLENAQIVPEQMDTE
jgi:FtsZ-binding cell division protein ZapB